jgi:hypothetical protein
MKGTLHAALLEVLMSDPRLPVPASTSFVDRVLNSDTAKRGIAATAASVIVAILTEAIWPSDE